MQGKYGLDNTSINALWCDTGSLLVTNHPGVCDVTYTSVMYRVTFFPLSKPHWAGLEIEHGNWPTGPPRPSITSHLWMNIKTSGTKKERRVFDLKHLLCLFLHGCCWTGCVLPAFSLYFNARQWTGNYLFIILTRQLQPAIHPPSWLTKFSPNPPIVRELWLAEVQNLSKHPRPVPPSVLWRKDSTSD